MRVARLVGSSAVIIALGSLFCTVGIAQVPGSNVNMVSGTQWPTGDPFLQRQNEPSLAVSTRNPLHLLAGANDYRTVDIPFPKGTGDENADAWLGIFRSFDGGDTWHSHLLPGYPQDQSPAGLASPLKAYRAATDPTVRAGTHGLFYYSGLAFDRDVNPASGVFLAVFQDHNNHGGGGPVAHLGTTMVATGTSRQFLDKPGLAVDIPRPGTAVGAATCTVEGNTISTGKVYVAFVDFTGSQTSTPHSRLFLSSSADCGAHWKRARLLSEGSRLGQSPAIAIDPGTGAVYVVWRELASLNQPDAILYVKSNDGCDTFTSPAPVFIFAPGQAFDQPDSATAIRIMTLPTVAVGPEGRVYVAWSQRGLGPNGDARIVVSTLARGSSSWTAPYVADPTAGGRGHQLMPALTSAYGKLLLIFYDQREDGTTGVLQCPQSGPCKTTADLVEVRVPAGDLPGNPDKVFTRYISDSGVSRRHTLDVRGALVDPAQFDPTAAVPLAFPSTRISQYKYGSRPGSNVIEQLQFNPPNFPMFDKGTEPFIGDYIDAAGLAFVPDPSGKWIYNTAPSNAPVFHTTWTDNRDVRPPPVVCHDGVCTQDWTQYTPVGSNGEPSLYDPTQSRPVCVPELTGSRNQNIYTSRITQGLLVGVKDNAKPLAAGLQRAFSVTVQNTTYATAYYRLTVDTPLPANTAASFAQGAGVTSVDVSVPPRSTVSRSLFVAPANLQLTFNPRATVSVSVTQIASSGGAPLAGGLQSAAVINPDITNPDIINPDIVNPDIVNPDITNPDITNPDITNAEVYNPKVTNPDITNPDITNPDIVNPVVTNPDIINPDIINPDITNMIVTNPDIVNPNCTNPDIVNPDIINPDIINPDITNLPDGGSATDLTWHITNKGNTSASYNTKLLARTALCCPAGCPGGANCPSSCYQCQLIVHRTYSTPVANACQLAVETQNVPVSNVPDPVFATPSGVATTDAGSDPTNATLTLGPGERGRVTLRVFGLASGALPPNAVMPVAVSHGANTGESRPAASLILNTLQLPVVVAGASYSANLQSAGGTGPSRAWSVFKGSLPSGLSVDPAAGLVGGIASAPGSYRVAFQVQDSPPAPTAPQVDRAAVTLQVNQLSIAAITVNQGNAGSAVLQGGDIATVSVKVSNNGPAAASAVAVALSVGQTSGTAAGVCSPVAPPDTTIPGNGSRVYKYSCRVSGDGSLVFQAQASAAYVNSVASVPASAPLAVSNSILVDSTAPTIAATALAGRSATPYYANTWTNQSVSLTFSCVDNASASAITPSGVQTTSPNGPTNFNQETGGATVTATCMDNAGNATSFTFGPVKIDKTPPAITIQVPANGATYDQNALVTSSYTCSDSLSGIAGCAGPVANGGSLDTATSGSKTFSVTATDRAGNTAVLLSSYNVRAQSQGEGDEFEWGGLPFGIQYAAAIAVRNRLIWTETGN